MPTELKTRSSRQQSLPSVIDTTETPNEITEATETPTEIIETPPMSLEDSIKARRELEITNLLSKNYYAINEQLDAKIATGKCDEGKLIELCKEGATLSGKPFADIVDRLGERLQLRINRLKLASAFARKDEIEANAKAARERGLNSRQVRDEKIKAAQDEYRQIQIDISSAESEIRQIEEARMALVKTCDDPVLLRQRKILNEHWESEREIASLNYKALRDAKANLNRAKENVANMMDGIGHTHHPQTIQNAKDQVGILEQMLPALEAAHERSTRIVDALNAEIEACDEAMTKA